MFDADGVMTIEGMVAIIAGVCIVLLLANFMLWLKLRKLRKGYKKMMAGSEGESIETLITNLQQAFNRMREEHGGQQEQIEFLMKQFSQMKGRVRMIRYNAFEETGSDLSFSIAILNDHSNGIVLTGIHGRDQSYMYAKPIENGQSSYHLSKEEDEVVSQARTDMASSIK